MILAIVGIVLSVIGFWREWGAFGALLASTIISGVVAVIFGGLSIAQPIALRQEMIRANLEREQIEYQITLVEADPTKEKVKLNEWILTYNDWVNDINAEKEFYGFFAWHYSFDMTNHTYIPLV